MECEKLNWILGAVGDDEGDEVIWEGCSDVEGVDCALVGKLLLKLEEALNSVCALFFCQALGCKKGVQRMIPCRGYIQAEEGG